ncbi:serine/threonine-protein kinase (plasmid) [Mycolicibacterium aichiense]|uniref:serine/threonine-protein kinase n=1 Tax=Mycolicibacterium aichiense TaxID=1799 RepID=UPI003D66E16B
MTAPEPASVTQIAGYRIDRVLATGGMSTIYLVRDPTLPQWDVLKVLSADLARDAALRDRFLREAGTTAGLHHPNIVSVYGRGETDDGQVWIAMQYVDGTDAEAAMQAGAMPPNRAIRIVTEVARALDFAHRRGVIHQDIKPSNFLLGDQGDEPERVVLSDFGIALTPHSADPADGPLLATLAYAAPEVVTGAGVDARTDVYALGCSLFRMLTGRYPFPSDDDLLATIKAHLDQAPPRLSDHLPWATRELDTVIATALAKDPAQRYATAGDFAAAASRALAAATPDAPAIGRRPTPPDPAPDDPTNPSQPTPDRSAAESGTRAVDFTGHLPRTQPVTSKRRLIIGAGLVAALAVVALVVWLVLPAQDAPRTPAAPTSTSPTPDPAAAAALTAALPPGYATGSCTPTPADPDLAVAAVTCGPAPGPGSPPTATYTLARDRGALQGLFNRVTATTTTVVCPGNIQSPGAWHRVANPTVAVGTVFCGLTDGRPLVAWTLDDKLFMATIAAQAPDTPTLDQLYTWWASHS